MVMPYKRVLPRDLFNEAKLLKCLGRVALILHDREGKYPVFWDHDDPDNTGFVINQNSTSGELYCVNLTLCREGCTGEDGEVWLRSSYNSREPWPLLFTDDNSIFEAAVFTDDGEFTREFEEYLLRRPNAKD